MSDFSQDDLNAFFKGKLENADPDGNTWSVPPDFVFDNAMNQVNAQRQSRKTSNKKLLLLLFIPFSILTGLFFNNHLGLAKINDKVKALETNLISSKTQIAQLENKLVLQQSNFAKQIEEQVLEINEAIKSEPKNLVNSKNALIANKKYEPDVKAIESVNVKSYKKISNNTNNNSNSILKRSNTVNKNADQFLTINSDVFKNDKDHEDRNVAKKQKLNKPTVLPLLHHTWPIDFEKSALDLILPSLVYVDIINNEKEFSEDVITYGILIRQNYSSLNMSDANTSIDLTSFDNSYSGLGIALQAQKSISSRFEMQFALGYDIINNRSQLSGVSLYDKNNEVEMSDGSMSYSMDIKTETPFGALNSAANFIVDSNASADQDPMNYLTKTTQSLNVISLNVGPKFKWLETKQWELFSTASLGYNRILHYENEINSSIKMDDKTMFEFRATPPKINDINKNFLSAQVGLGFGFKFSEELQLAMSANYGRTLNSLRVARTAVDPVTHLSQWNSQIGFNFSF